MSNTIARKIKFILLVILCSVFGCVVMVNLAEQGSKGRTPIKSIVISFDAAEKDVFFTQITQFADKHSFNMYIRDVEVETGPSGKGFFGEMLRNDVDITIFGTPNAPIEVSIGFDIQDSNSFPTQETINELYNDLKTYIIEIPSVIILEEK